MLPFFILLCLPIIPIFLIIFFVFKRFWIDDAQEFNFTSTNSSDEFDTEITPAPREHKAYETQQSSLIALAIKRAPKTIATICILQLFSFMFTTYLGMTNAERLAMAASSAHNGDYGTAISELFTLAKPRILEQMRVATGNHPFLEDNHLTNFAYIGTENGVSHAVMKNPYSTQDHDPSIKENDPSYGNFITGLSADKAENICENKYEDFHGKLLSFEIWQLSRSHIFAARNVRENQTIPEWTSNISKKDSDLHLLLGKESNAREFIVQNKIDNEENGLYVDGDDYESSAFRCEISW